MRIAILALVGMAVTLPCAIAIAQPAAAVPPPTAPAPTGSLSLPPPTTLPRIETAETKPADITPPIAGWHGGFFLRDPGDYFRIYPKLRVHIDFTSSFGVGVSKVAAVDGGNALKARLFLRRLEFELGGEFLKRWTFNGGFEVAQPISNADGRTQSSASRPGEAPTADTSRFAPVQAPTPGIGIADAWINYTAALWFNVMLGQYNTPFSLENRTSNNSTSLMERNVAIRGFVRTSNKDIGLTLWGEVANKLLNYEIGVFAGDGQNRPQIDNNVDFLGRVFVKPFVNLKGSILQKAQIGVSAHHGDRDPRYVGYDYAPITSGNGSALWNPGYKDSLGRNIHVIPSAGQNAVGGELRLPLYPRQELRGEVYYVANNTREAVEGYQLTNNERFGQVRGVGWYVQLSTWVNRISPSFDWRGDAYVSGDDVGLVRPTRLDFSKKPEALKRGLEVVVLYAGIDASYDGASRGGEYDASTPGNTSAAGRAGKTITVHQTGFGLNYWHSSYIRATVNYFFYVTPDSSSTKNVAPILHELGTRVGIAF
jgi:hypothetical protein